jgi:hypothetical protein
MSMFVSRFKNQQDGDMTREYQHREVICHPLSKPNGKDLIKALQSVACPAHMEGRDYVVERFTEDDVTNLVRRMHEYCMERDTKLDIVRDDRTLMRKR